MVCSIFYQIIHVIVNTNIYQFNNAIVINKKASKILTFFVSKITLFSLKFVLTGFVPSVSIISSHVITELSLILVKYLLFLELHIAGFHILFDIYCVFTLTSTFIIISLLIWITFSTIKFIFTFTWCMFS